MKKKYAKDKKFNDLLDQLSMITYNHVTSLDLSGARGLVKWQYF